MKDDRLHLLYIIEAIDKILQYTKEGRDAFIANPMAQDAVIRNFEIIGEAVKQLSAEVKKKNPKIPWKRIAGFRDVLIHDYMMVELEEVWNVVSHHLADLGREINSIVNQYK